MLCNADNLLLVHPSRRDWDSDSLLKSIDNIDDLSISPEQTKMRYQRLWKDAYSEYDARHLQIEVIRRNVLKTPESQAFFQAWAADEERHTRGFIYLMKILANTKPEDTQNALDSRSHDFSEMDYYLQDEFTLLVILAFDEIVTCHAYATDRDFYRNLPHIAFIKWLHGLIADEATHFRNAVNVLRACHSHRLSEVKAIVDGLVGGVADASDYKGTFVLDHFGDDYTPELMDSCRQALLRTVLR